MEKDRSKRRYQPGKKLGAGDFATVFAATDLKLNREVAVKQLHPQFLQDPTQLERYWQEAQLLGSIEHPNIMTIYDVVKSKGCLILEQMQGSLKEVYGSNPMPVDEVRELLLHAANGLKCLHENGIVHGDVKPGNLFLSRQEMVKLGDFGLARRVADDEGSLVKGTTRYMAPELVSEEFGDVGPASDLYSLGFSALEMMVGPQFESLFPDLIAFGRDRQMAWMMWHCSADRKLPPVQTLLEGVPDDVALVLQKLTAKKQSERYQSADEVIADLSGYKAPVGDSLRQAAEDAERLARQKRKKRLRLAAICLCSLLITGGIVAAAFWPEAEVVKRNVPEPVRGVVQNVLPIDQKLVLDIGTDWKEYSLREGDSLTLNRKERQLRDLENGDRVVVHSRLTEDNKIRFEIVAFRPESHSGVITQVNADDAQFVLKVTEGEEIDETFELSVPPETSIIINAKSELAGKAFTVEALQAGDRVVVDHSDDEEGMLALAIEAIRETSLEGFARKIDVRNRMITIALDESQQDATQFVRIPLDQNCLVKLNDYASLDDQLVKVSDLLPGDKVTLTYDLKVKSIDAFRIFRDSGSILTTDSSASKLTIRNDDGKPQTYTVTSDLEIQLGDETVSLAELRRSDQVNITHVFPGETEPTLQSLQARRPANSKRWALLIANSQFSDTAIPALQTSLNNSETIREKMVTRYAIPGSQALACTNFGTVRLREEIPTWLNNIPADAELYVYVSTRAFFDSGKGVFLATQDSTREEIDETGIKIDWLIDQLDRCATSQKILMLDCTPEDSATDSSQISSEEIVKVMRSNHRGGYPKSVYLLGNSSKGQVGQTVDGISTFASEIANGFGGAADDVGDNQLEVTELADYVERAFNKPGAATKTVFYLPDASPPRISDNAKFAIIEFLALFSERKLDMEMIDAEYLRINTLATGQPEPAMAYALMLMKDSQMDKALTVFDKIRLNQPSYLPAQKAAIWLDFYKNRYDNGVAKIINLLEQIPPPEEMDKPYSERTESEFEWIGRLRELAAAADWTERTPAPEKVTQVDEMIQSFGKIPQNKFSEGRKRVRDIIAKFDADLKEDPQSLSKLKKRRIREYVDGVANEALIAEIIEGLDQ